jgi:hypothetical protein
LNKRTIKKAHVKLINFLIIDYIKLVTAKMTLLLENSYTYKWVFLL